MRSPSSLMGAGRAVLGGRTLARQPPENFLRHAQLADVVEQGAARQILALARVEADLGAGPAASATRNE
jgi:hypothetical protein